MAVTTLLLVGSFLLPAESAPDALISRMQSRYNDAKTLSVQFEEQYSLLGHRRPPEQGRLTLKKQGKMRWDYANPAGKVFVSDGKTVFLYTAGDNRVENIPLKDTEDMRAPLAFLLGHFDMKKEFHDFRTRNAEGGTWLTAAAKNDRVPYTQIEMLLTSEGEVRQLRITGRDQSELGFRFSGESLNPPVSDALFHFQIPAGAEVVNSIETAAQER